ncbi:uncharacterized protein LOC124542871 [Vanessa cardui]|uniref:uncharacterized protein LOC124542871 n=1 Tax=Vanessa cardui TaxID=171605 RepID=UPI001F13A6A6|nr:uncharacterized protein LOC124542871 [Vanessa cardui]
MEEEADSYFNDNYCDYKCVCYETISEPISEHVDITGRKEFILSTVTRTENYLRERRIPELIRFLFTKVIAHSPDKPVAFLEQLLDDCMLFRAGHGLPPVLYENRHLEAIVKSFDPALRGSLSAGQVRRLYNTLGFSFSEISAERVPCDEVLKNLKITQENDLAQLLGAGVMEE